MQASGYPLQLQQLQHKVQHTNRRASESKIFAVAFPAVSSPFTKHALLAGTAVYNCPAAAAYAAATGYAHGVINSYQKHCYAACMHVQEMSSCKDTHEVYVHAQMWPNRAAAFVHMSHTACNAWLFPVVHATCYCCALCCAADGQQMVSIICSALRAVAADQGAAIDDVCHSNATAIAQTVAELEHMQLTVEDVKASLLGANQIMQVSRRMLAAFAACDVGRGGG
jgi:hypothetical protein